MVNANSDLAAANSKYVMRITGDNDEGKAQLDNFIDPESTYPVVCTTSRLMSTGVDAQTCHLIVLDRRIASMTEFKQIIGRGTRINEDYGKLYFTIMDFRRATAMFADPDFDGDPVQIYEPGESETVVPPDDLVDDRRPDREIRHEVTVHHVHVDLVGAAREDVLSTWQQLVALHQKTHALLREKKDAELALGEEPSEANLAWLKDVSARLESLDGTEALIEGFGELSGRFRQSV